MSKISFICQFTFFIAFWMFGRLQGQEVRPNIVFILVDDLGYGDLGVYGHPHIHTPHLDKLAGEGIRFTDFYSPSPLCSPARAGMLTGRTPFRTGIQSWIPEGEQVYLRKRERTLAAILQDHGYQTYMTGKWHLNGGLGDANFPQPEDHGFDDWMALHAFAIPHHQNPTNFYENGVPLGVVEGFSAGIVMNKALDFLIRRDTARPFFLYVPMNEPHSEIASPPEFNGMYRAFTKGTIDPNVLEYRGPGEYYANITYMDHQVGRLMDQLDRLGLRENTLVVFTSDNGPVTEQWRKPWEVNMFGSTGGFRGRKGDLFEGGIRVPCFMRLPGAIEAGTVSEVPVHGYDFLPTICGLLDLPLPADRPIDGIDISPVFQGEIPVRESPLFWAFVLQSDQDPPGYYYAVREGDWKCISDYDVEKTLLYNLASDPYELTELSVKHPEVVKRLQEKIRAMKKSIAEDPIRPR